MKRNQSLIRTLMIGTAAIALTATATLPFVGITSLAKAAMRIATSYVGKYPKLNEPGLQLGAYDPHGDFTNTAGLTIEGVFLPWQDVDLASFQAADAYALERGRKMLITVEPWSWAGDWRLTTTQLKDAVLSGRYDSTVVSICKLIGQLKSPTTIRWAQEMDNTSGRFSWSGWKPQDYITAYRRVVDQCRPLSPKTTYMWSPQGQPGLVDYYPGDAYTDEIGLSVFGLQQYDRDKFGRDRTFAEILKPGYDLVARFNKPVVVAELGYVGDEAYNRSWAESVTKQYPEFPKLTGVVYFDDKEVFPWPKPYGLPDWRVVAPSVTN